MNLSIEEVAFPTQEGPIIVSQETEEGLTCGYATIHVYDDCWLLSHLFIAHSFRRKGYGSKLLEKVLTRAMDEAPNATVVLAVRPDEYSGMDEWQLAEWYERHGFKDHATWGRYGVLVTI